MARQTQAAAGTAYPPVAGSVALHAASAALLVVITAALYAGALDLGFFHWDDPYYVVDNPWIRSASAENLAAVLSRPYFGNYSPTHLLSYVVDHAVGGLDPRIFHLSSHLWAGACAAGVYLVALQLFGQPGPAFAAGLLFAVHPAHVEAVAWISSRKDLVATAFALPSIAAYLVARRATGARLHAAYGLSVALFALAIGGKLSVAVVPGLLLLLDAWWERRRGRGMLLDKLPYLVIALGFTAIVARAQPGTGQSFDAYVFARSLVESLWLLTGFGDYVLARGRPDPAAPDALRALWIGLAASAFALPVLGARRFPAPFRVLWTWPVLALLPTQVLPFIHPVADRYLFFPSVGAVLLTIWTGRAIARRAGPRAPLVAAGATAAVTLLWARATLAYLGEWQDPRSVWFAASRRSQDVAVSLYLGAHYQDQAERLDPGAGDAAARGRAEALARALWAGDERLGPLLREWQDGARGANTEAFRHALRGLAKQQLDLALERKGNRALPALYVRLAKLAEAERDFDQALVWYEYAYAESRIHTLERYRRENEAGIFYNVGMVYGEKGDCDEARRWLSAAEAAQADLQPPPVPQLAAERRRVEERCVPRADSATPAERGR